MLNFALVGCGSMAHWHAQQLQKIPGVKVVALCDPAVNHMRRFREQYFKEAAEYGEYERLLEHPPVKLDAVVLVTPHHLHYPQAKMALERGVHVLVEKPMVTDSGHAQDLWRTVKRTGKLLGITFQAPYTPQFAYLARQRDLGKLGRLQVFSGWLAQGWMKGTANTWRQDLSLSGGGQLYDAAAHLFNALIWLISDPVLEVCCFYDKCHTPVDINGVAIVRFRGGGMGSIAVGGNCPAFRTEIQIQTDSMLIITDQYGGRLEMTGHDGRPVELPHDLRGSGENAAGTPHANFIKAIRGEEPLRVTARHGVLLCNLMDAIYQSGAGGRIVKVNPIPEG